jgi:DNA-binding transcriptional LysR family regulator
VTHARSLARDAGLDLADVRVEVRDWTSSFSLVREGLGVTLVPEPALPEDRRGLRVLRLHEPLYREFWLRVSSRSSGSPAVRALLDVASANRLPKHVAREQAQTGLERGMPSDLG